MPTEMLIIGAGGHSKVVIEALEASEVDTEIILTDHDDTKSGQFLFGAQLISKLQDWILLPDLFHVAVGNNCYRKKCFLEAREQGKKPVNIVHPKASISPSAKIENGGFVGATAVVSAEVYIGPGCIINHGVIVDHDCRVGSFSHIAPNATLGGGVVVGEECLIGAGATILPEIKIGDRAVIGAGAVILSDVPDGQTYIGVPGRQV